MEAAAPWFRRHGAAFLAGLEQRADIARLEFDAIDAMGKRLSFDRALQVARKIIEPVLGTGG